MTRGSPKDAAADLFYTVSHYRQVFGRTPNLTRPEAFSEWIAWKKLHDRNPLLTKLADKWAVRAYVTERVGASYLTRALCVTEAPEQIDVASLPMQFVAKATHGSGCNLMVRDRSEADWPRAVRLFRRWLAMNFYEVGREWCYRDIPPRILVEELLIDDEGRVPADMKFFCFAGEPRFIEVDVDRFGDHRRNLYDARWNRLPVSLHVGNFEWPMAPPATLREMLRIAAALSSGLDFVRVDLYSLGDRIVFGEMTNYPGNGFQKFTPDEYDRVFGREWPRVDTRGTSL